MIECTLDYSTLSADGKKLQLVCHGIGTYEVVSGLYAFHNDVNCSYKTNAPIPPGWYYITERKDGTWRASIQNTAQKYWRSMWGIHNDKEKWFSLISVQRSSNEMIVNGNSRGGFKFHPLNSDGSGHSEGCVTFYNYHEFMILRNRMLRGNTMQLKEKEHGFVKAYGTLHVVGHPDFSKCNISPKSWES